MPERDFNKDLLVLRKHIDRASITCEKVNERKFSYGETDHYGFMLLCFFMKQAEHLRSIAVLVDAGQYKDATAIARIMLEGMSTLVWAANDREHRPLQWRSFALVSDWELLQDKKQAGEAVDPEHEKRLTQRLEKHGPKFFTKRTRRSDVVHDEWHFQKTWLLDSDGGHIKRGDIFKEINGAGLYEVYEDFSQWLHWTPRALGQCLECQESATAYNPNDYRSAAQALAVAFQSVVQTLHLLFEHFKLATAPTLEQLKMDYIKDLGLHEFE